MTTISRAAVVAAAALAAGCGGIAGQPSVRDPGCRQVEFADSPAAAPEVQWAVAVSGTERIVLDAWCAAVGEGLLAPLPAPALPHPAAGPTDSLVVVSWNVYGGGGSVRQMVEDLRGGDLGEPARHFVLLLQEAYRAGDLPDPPEGAVVPEGVRSAPPSGEREDVARVARDLGLSLFYVPSMRNGLEPPGAEAEDRGNAILATLPLLDPRVIELPYESQRRVAVAATVLAPGPDPRGHALRVASVHLDTRSAWRRPWAGFGAGRLRQARALVEALPEDGATVVAGDLNTWSLAALEDALPYLRALFPQTPDVPDLATMTTTWGYRRRLDHMFFRLPEEWSVEYRRLDSRYGSDHHPLVARIRFGGAAQ